MLDHFNWKQDFCILWSNINTGLRWTSMYSKSNENWCLCYTKHESKNCSHLGRRARERFKSQSHETKKNSIINAFKFKVLSFFSVLLCNIKTIFITLCIVCHKHIQVSQRHQGSMEILQSKGTVFRSIQSLWYWEWEMQ